MKRLVKQVAQTVVAAAAPAWWRTRSDSLLVMMYHRVLPPNHADRGSEQPGMFVSPDTLALHLSLLKQYFEIVHLDDWLRRVGAGQPVPARAAVITFDDGWRDNYDHAWPVLQAAGVPSTIYLVTDLVGTRYSFWPNTLARSLAAGPEARASWPEWLRVLANQHVGSELNPHAEQIDAVINVCKATRSDAEMREVAGAIPGERDLMSWPEIEEMRANDLVRFGSHTRRHTRLSRVEDRATLEDEVLGSRKVLQERLDKVSDTFCFPNGDTSAEAIACVRSAYLGAVTTQSGWNERGHDPFQLRRIGVHEDVSASRTQLLSRLCGVG